MALDPWLLGVHVTQLTISGLTVASNGALAIGATVNVVDQFVEIDPTGREEVSDVRPTNQYQMNEMGTGGGAELRVSCLQRADAYNAITTLWMAGYRYYEIIWTQGVEPFTFRGRARNKNWGVKSREGNPDVLELGPIAEGETYNLSRA